MDSNAGFAVVEATTSQSTCLENIPAVLGIQR
jgi:hypothetical protein